MEFGSANPTIVKSIKQRDLLNTWLRLYGAEQSMPRIAEYQPSRLEEELPDLVFLTVDNAPHAPRLTIESDGVRLSSAFGNSGKGRYLDEYLGSRLAPLVMPIYRECLKRKLPVYTVSDVDDSYGRIVAYAYALRDGTELFAQGELIASGFARVADRIGSKTCAAELLADENTARAAKLGLWGDPYYDVLNADTPVDVLARQGRFALVEGRVVSVRESGATTYVNFGR